MQNLNDTLDALVRDSGLITIRLSNVMDALGLDGGEEVEEDVPLTLSEKVNILVDDIKRMNTQLDAIDTELGIQNG